MRMKFKINRIYYWLDRKFRFGVLGWLSSLAVFALLSLLIYRSLEPTDLLALLSVAAIGVAVRFFLRQPRELTIEGGRLYVVQYLKKSDDDDVRHRVRGYEPTRKTYVTVLSATRIEYTQSAHEISRDVGRVMIFGTFLTGDRYGNFNNVYKPPFIELYGIKDFSKASAELRAAFPDAEHV